MNTKNCNYRNCENTSVSSKLTFFGFPVKDTQKCKLWSDRAGCETDNLKNKFLCEDHFSHIYISRTARRTVLLPNAVPFHWDDNKSHEHLNAYRPANVPSKENVKGETDFENTVVEMMFIGGNGKDVTALDDNHENNESINNETIVDDCSDGMKQIEEDHSPDLRNFFSKTNVDRIGYGKDFKHVTKRQKVQTSANSSTLTPLSSDSVQSSDLHENVDDDKNNPIDNTVDNPDITTFIYKGEEYIQMPKRIYIDQRAQLDADIKRLRETLRSIQTLVKHLE